MWVKASIDKFLEHGIVIDTQRQLNDGEYIMHMELTEYPDFFMESRFDEEVKFLKTKQLETLLALEAGIV